MKKQVRSLKPGMIMLAQNKTNENDRAVAIILANDYASKYCIIHAFNYRNNELYKEWTKEYSYKDMKEIMRSCHSIQ